MNATDIIKICTDLFPTSPHDCGDYVVAIEKKCFSATVFDTSMSADAMITAAKATTSGWISLGKDKDKAILAAKNGDVVLACMTSTEQASAHGHIAVVAGVDGQDSAPTPPPVVAPVKVPLGFARSIADASLPLTDKGAHEALQDRLTRTFKAAHVRGGKVSYYHKAPTL